MRLLRAVTVLETGRGEQRAESISAHILFSDGGMKCRGRGNRGWQGEERREAVSCDCCL